MRDQLDPTERVNVVQSPRTEPWTFALNASAQNADIHITLCSYVVVGEFSRVTGVIRVRTTQDVRLGSVPTLTISSPGLQSMHAVSAHVLPQGPLTWVSWLYRRAVPDEPRAYEAHIDRVDVAFVTGKRPTQSVSGPWTFRFEVPAPPAEAPSVVA